MVAWLTNDEARAFEAGHLDGRTFRALIERFVVGGDVDLRGSTPVGFELPIDAPASARPLVVVDVDRSFWSTLLGDGPGMVGIGAKESDEVVVARAPAAKPAGEPCSGDRRALIVVSAPELSGAVGNATERRFCAHLPPSYAAATTRRYPVVYGFGGFMSNEMVRLRGRRHAGDVLDAIAHETGREAIFVGVDASCAVGSSYLEDSPAIGPWATFMATKAIDAIDARLRTIPKSEGRALIGQSTGGFLAVSFAMRHPERFGAIGATAPDALDLEPWLFDGTRRVKPWIFSWMRLEAALGGAGQMTSYAAAWSPTPAGRWELPFDLATGSVTPALDRWLARSPSRMLDDEAFAARVRARLSGKLLLAISADDEFDLTPPARSFARKLEALGIEHRLEITPEGHLEGGAARTERALRFVVEKLSPASD